MTVIINFWYISNNFGKIFAIRTPTFRLSSLELSNWGWANIMEQNKSGLKAFNFYSKGLEECLRLCEELTKAW